jgi:hypothetical protein
MRRVVLLVHDLDELVEPRGDVSKAVPGVHVNIDYRKPGLGRLMVWQPQLRLGAKLLQRQRPAVFTVQREWRVLPKR